MQSAPCRGDALRGVQSRGTADRNHGHRLMLQEFIEIRVRFGSVFLRECLDLRAVAAEDRRDGNAGYRGGCPRVGFTDVASTNQSNMDGHKLREIAVILSGCYKL